MGRQFRSSLVLLSISIIPFTTAIHSSPPLVVNTWSGAFTTATNAAYSSLLNSSSPFSPTSISPIAALLDSVQAGCTACQTAQCDRTVGFGGSPDEMCETSLDALIINGDTLDAGAVANLRRVKDAIGVARHVLEYTAHTLLAGEEATQFALQNGFLEEDLSTSESRAKCDAWKEKSCQPNYRVNVFPDARTSCGPYSPLHIDTSSSSSPRSNPRGNPPSHDTLSLIALHPSGSLVSGTTTNGAAHKLPGRVGDGPIPGSGSYADSHIGGCGATGDGDVMMRFLPCYQAVESMRRGLTPQEAADDAVMRILARYPDAHTGIVVVNKDGEHAAAASGWSFTYSYRGFGMADVEVVTITPLNARLDNDEL